MQEALFSQALGLTPPWEVEDVKFDQAARRIDLNVVWRAATGACPACEAPDQAIHDRRSRSWRHMDFFQFEAHIHCEVPRVACLKCGQTTQMKLPWARVASRFTLMFEALALTLAREMPVAVCARLLRCSANALWRLIDLHTSVARARESHANVRTLGIDETACRRGQNYITLVHDLDEQRLLFATHGRDSSTIEAAARDLAAHGGDARSITQVCMDMSRAYIAGVRAHMSAASMVFDRFHIIQMANVALDLVRREEVRDEPELKGTRWCWLKDAKDWTRSQITEMHWLTRARLKTARAWRLKEALRDIYRQAPTPEQARIALTQWTSWARRSRLEPMKKLANTIKAHWQGVVAAFGEARLHNGYVEAVNSLVQAAKARARGYGTSRHFIAMCYLIAGKLKHLPRSPFLASTQAG